MKRIKTVIHILRGLIHTCVHKKHICAKKWYKGKLRIDGKVFVRYKEDAKILIDGILNLGYDSKGNNGRSSVIIMEKGSQIQIQGCADLFYGADIILFENAVLKIGSSFINSNCRLRIKSSMSIGDDCAISHDFTAMDSNFHSLYGSVTGASVVIDDHVWIGTRVTILPNVHIGTGAVIAAGSIVTKDVPAYSLAAGNPARVIKENVTWHI